MNNSKEITQVKKAIEAMKTRLGGISLKQRLLYKSVDNRYINYCAGLTALKLELGKLETE